MTLRRIHCDSCVRMASPSPSGTASYGDEIRTVLDDLWGLGRSKRSQSKTAAVIAGVVGVGVSASGLSGPGTSALVAGPDLEIFEALAEHYGIGMSEVEWYTRLVGWLKNPKTLMSHYSTTHREFQICKDFGRAAKSEEREIYRRVWQWSDVERVEFQDDCRSAGLELDAPFVEILQRWNSCTPALQSGLHSDGNEVGGGLLLWDGAGALAVDPGYDFMRNYFRAGWRLSSLLGVFMTHAHDDHTADLERLVSIWYKCRATLGTDVFHDLKIYCTRNTARKFEQLRVGTAGVCDWKSVDPGDQIALGNMKIDVFLVRHNEAPFNFGSPDASAGIHVQFTNGFRGALAYSGDTHYLPSLREGIGDAETVILNIGTAGVGSPNHLGVHGCARVIADTMDRRRLYVISEWMREAIGKRSAMIEMMAKIVNVSSGIGTEEIGARILPAEVFMRIGLDPAERRVAIPGTNGWIKIDEKLTTARDCQMSLGKHICYLK